MIPKRIIKPEKIVISNGVFSSSRSLQEIYLISIIRFVMILRKFSIRNLFGNVKMLRPMKKPKILPINELRNLRLLKYEAIPVKTAKVT